MKKLWKILFAALLVLPLFTGVLGAKAVTAAEATTTNVTINKRIWKDGEAPAQGSKQNTGEEMDFGGDPLHNQYQHNEARQDGAGLLPAVGVHGEDQRRADAAGPHQAQHHQGEILRRAKVKGQSCQRRRRAGRCPLHGQRAGIFAAAQPRYAG